MDAPLGTHVCMSLPLVSFSSFLFSFSCGFFFPCRKFPLPVSTQHVYITDNPYCVQTAQLLCAIMVHVGQLILGGQQPAISVAAAVADDKVWTVGVVSRESAARTVVGG